MLAPPPVIRTQIGITIWLETIVERAIAATITIDVAEENPPRKDNIARPSRPLTKRDSQHKQIRV